MKRWVAVFTVFSLLLLVVIPACGGREGEKTSAPSHADSDSNTCSDTYTDYFD